VKKVFTRYITISNVIDGDTVKCSKIDLGDNVFLANKAVRLLSLDTPELSSDNPLEVEAALIVKAFVASKLLPGKEYQFVSLEKADKYKRGLGSIQDSSGQDIGTQLIQRGYAREYHGDHKMPWSDAELQHIIDFPVAPPVGGTTATTAGIGQQEREL
jgi:endonuclease YncB( thermonuclease family)